MVHTTESSPRSFPGGSSTEPGQSRTTSSAPAASPNTDGLQTASGVGERLVLAGTRARPERHGAEHDAAPPEVADLLGRHPGHGTDETEVSQVARDQDGAHRVLLVGARGALELPTEEVRQLGGPRVIHAQPVRALVREPGSGSRSTFFALSIQSLITVVAPAASLTTSVL